jgi:hypothetical protein
MFLWYRRVKSKKRFCIFNVFMVIRSFANFFVTHFFAIVLKHPLKMPESKASPARKSLGDVKVKYSPVKKSNNKHNNVFVKGYKFGLMSLELKKFLEMRTLRISLMY